MGYAYILVFMLRYVIVFIFIGHSVVSLGSINPAIEPYLEKVKKAKNLEDPIERDSILVWSYGQLCDEIFRINDSNSLSYLDTLDALSEASQWPNARGIYYRGVGRYYDFRGEHEEALEYYDKAISALKPGHGDLKELAFTYVLKGFLLSNSGLQQECKKVMQEGLPYAKKAKSKNSQCFMLDWYGDYYYYGLDDTIDYKKALYYYKQVEEILPQINYARLIADNHAVLSGCYERLGQISRSKYHFKVADSITQAQNLLFVRRGLYADKARLLEENGENKAANAIYVQIANFLEGNRNIEFQARAESDLWQSYKKIGNYKLALKHYEEWRWMEDSLANQDVAVKYAELEKKYDVAQKENEITTLENKEAKTRMNLLLLLGGVSLLGLIIILRKNAQLSKSKRSLVESYEMSQEATFKGEQNERSRIASELHDNVNSKIAAIK